MDKKYIPIGISSFRILLSPLFLYLLSVDKKTFGFVVLVLGAVTDFLDGYVARSLNATSKFGELIDPLADKVFVNCVMWGIYAYVTPLPSTLITAIILSVRDIFLLFGGAYITFLKKNLEIKPVYMSKICTALIFILCCLVLFIKKNNTYIILLNYFVIFLICTTMIMYILRYIKNKKKS
ncbi:MAG: CDP-alcohol phosphatidyltransferase family protein [Holosporales bacterium]|nr:CDP-alcohol phosphatidyltransferase family protein [Holosporales bacterium]